MKEILLVLIKGIDIFGINTFGALEKKKIFILV